DVVVERAAEAEHRVAAVAAERLPEVKEAASDVAEKVVDTVSRAGETAVTRLRHPTRHSPVITTPENERTANTNDRKDRAHGDGHQAGQGGSGKGGGAGEGSPSRRRPGQGGGR